MKKPKHTRIASIRRGFEYQDAESIKVFLTWLENPNIYRWIKLEADEHLFLDDIVAMRNDGSLDLIQVKFSLHPDYPEKKWDWKDLILIKKNNSLLRRWFISWREARKNIKSVNPIISTNKMAFGDLSQTLVAIEGRSYKVNIKNLKGKKIYSEIKKHLNAKENEVIKFLSQMRFMLDADLDALWENLHNIFTTVLCGTEVGWESLKFVTREWTIYKDKPSADGHILIQHIRQAAKWQVLKPLYQSFPIPPDYVPFDTTLLNNLSAELTSREGGIKILHGVPGAGKSTFLSHLYSILTDEKKAPVIKHHYYIESNREFYERLEYQKSVESLKHSFFFEKELRESIKCYLQKNPASISLKDLVNESANYFHAKGKSLIVIIDGLDHVLYHGDIKDMTRFLKEFLPLPEGLWLILGTQSSVIDQLPQILKSKTNSENMHEVKPLPYRAINKILNFHKKQLRIQRHFYQEFITKLFKLSEGNPLHLRYCIRYLYSLEATSLIPKDIDNIPPYSGTIQQYYRILWDTLDSIAIEIAVMLASINIDLSDEQIVTIMSQNQPSVTQVSEGLSTLHHLLTVRHNTVKFFHPSFKIFVKSTTQYIHLCRNVKQKLLQWLKSNGSEYLKWYYVGILEAELGNPQVLLSSLNRQWVERALKATRPPSRILLILRKGFYLALQKNDYPKAVELGLLMSYLQKITKEFSDAWDRIWQLRHSRSTVSYHIANEGLTNLSLTQLKVVAGQVMDIGDRALVEEIFEEINFRIIARENHDDSFFPLIGEIIGTVEADYVRFYRWLKQFTGTNRVNILKSYVKSQINKHQDTNLNRFIVAVNVTSEDKSIIAETLARNSLIHKNIKQWITKDVDEKYWRAWMYLYILLTSKRKSFKAIKVANIPQPEDFPSSKTFYLEERVLFAKKFFNLFLYTIIFQFSPKKALIDNYVQRCTDNWCHKAYKKIVAVAKAVAKSITTKKFVDYSLIVDSFNGLGVPRWPRDRDNYDYFIALQEAMKEVLLVIHIINTSADNRTLNTNDVKCFNNFDFLPSKYIIDLAVDENRNILDDKSCKYLLRFHERHWDKKITYLYERAEAYAKLAFLATQYNFKTYANKLTDKSIVNLLGHGYHKDIILHLILDSIDSCYKAGSKQSRTWLQRLIPIVMSVTEYTDGDETNYLSQRLADSLVPMDNNKLLNYYLDSAQNEKFHLAEALFTKVVSILKLSNPLERAVASTGLDSATQNVLNEMRREGNNGAKRVLSDNRMYFGELHAQMKQSHLKMKRQQRLNIEYHKIPPGKMKQKLKKIDYINKYQFINEWIDYWSQKQSKRKQVYECIRDCILDRETMRESELINKIFKYIIEFESSEEAFNMLCMANIQGYGWDKYFGDTNCTLYRWQLLKQYFPDRWTEFLARTLGRKPYEKVPTFEYFASIPNIVDFFVFFDDFKTAEKITKRIVNFVESLMGNLTLNKPQWLYKRNSSMHDVLLSRLMWPSPIVKERTAEGLYNLLLDNRVWKKTFIFLTKWLSKQRIESLIVQGLLPILKSIRNKRNRFTVKFAQIRASVKVPSILTYMMIVEINNALGFDNSVLSPYKSKRRKKFPTDFCPDDFLSRYCRAFIPPIYMTNAQRLEREYHIDFIKQWTWEFERLIKATQTTKEYDSARSYHDDPTGAQLVGFSSKISEIFKSSYLRALEFYNLHQRIPDWLYYQYSYQICPIDVALWEIGTRNHPVWWPVSLMRESQKDIDVTASKCIELIDQVIKHQCLETQSSKVVLFAQGPILPLTISSDGESSADTIIIGFAYKCIGSRMPTDEDLLDSLLVNSAWYPDPNTSKPYTHFDNPHNAVFNPNNNNIKCADLIIYPLIGRIKLHVIDTWQWFKFWSAGSLFGLSGFLFADDITFKRRKKQYSYYSKTLNETVAGAYTWTGGISERTKYNLPVPAGHIVEVDRNWLMDQLSKQNLRLGFVRKMQYFIQKNSYTEPEVYSSVRSFGISPIVLPNSALDNNE